MFFVNSRCSAAMVVKSRLGTRLPRRSGLWLVRSVQLCRQTWTLCGQHKSGNADQNMVTDDGYGDQYVCSALDGQVMLR
jgi:hypothetical protein